MITAPETEKGAASSSSRAPKTVHHARRFPFSLFSGHGRKRTLALNVKVLDDDPRRLPGRPDAEGHRAQRAGVFALRLVEEHVAVPVPQRKRLFLWPDPQDERPVFLLNFEVAEVVVMVRPGVGF